MQDTPSGAGRCLVTGGTGFSGGHLVERLCRDGWDVTVLVRPSSDTRVVERAGARILVGDLKEPDLLTGAAREQDVVFHLAQIGLSNPAFLDGNLAAVDALIAGACTNPSFRRLVYLSSMTVGCRAARLPADELTPVKKPLDDIYTTLCRRTEQLLVHSDVPVTVLRAGLLYGPRAATLARFVSLLLKFRHLGLPLPGRHSTLLPFMQVGDCAEALVRASRASDSHVQLYYVVDDEPKPLSRFVDLIGEHLGVGLQLRRVPFSVQWSGAWLLDQLQLVGDYPNASALVRILSHDNHFSNQRMKEDLGIELRYPRLEDGLGTMMDWYTGTRGPIPR